MYTRQLCVNEKPGPRERRRRHRYGREIQQDMCHSESAVSARSTRATLFHASTTAVARSGPNGFPLVKRRGRTRRDPCLLIDLATTNKTEPAPIRSGSAVPAERWPLRRGCHYVLARVVSRSRVRLCRPTGRMGAAFGWHPPPAAIGSARGGNPYSLVTSSPVRPAAGDSRFVAALVQYTFATVSPATNTSGHPPPADATGCVGPRRYRVQNRVPAAEDRRHVSHRGRRVLRCRDRCGARADSSPRPRRTRGERVNSRRWT